MKLMGGNAEEGEALWHNRVWWRGLVFLLDSEGSFAQLPEEGSTHLTVAFDIVLFSTPELCCLHEIPACLGQIITYLVHERRNILS